MKRKKLFYRYFFPMVFVAIAPIVLGGLILYYLVAEDIMKMQNTVIGHSSEALRTQVSFKNEAIARATGGRIERYICDREREIYAMSISPVFKEMDLEKIKLYCNTLLYKTPSLLELSVVDKAGTEIFKISNIFSIYEGDYKNISGEKPFDAIRNGDFYISDIEVSKITYLPCTTIAFPIERYKGEIEGGVLAKIDLSAVWRVVGSPEIGEKGILYIVSKNGRLITHPSQKEIYENPDYYKYDYIRRILAAKHGTIIAADRLISFSTNSYLWTTIIDVPLEKALSSIAENKKAIYNSARATIREITVTKTIIIFTVIIISILAGISVTRKVTSPLFELKNSTQKIAQGDFSSRVNIATNDEIGDLAISFNKMAENLQNTTTSIHNLNREITQRKKTEEALLESEDRLKQVAESAGDWIWEVNTEGLYIYSSPAAEEILGYKPEEIVGKKHFYDFFAPDIKEEYKKGALEIFNKKECFRGFVNANIHKNGSTVILETSGIPVIDDKGNLRGYRGVDRDITECKKNEKILRDLNEELKITVDKLAAANRELASFAYIIAHDLKAPLRAIESLAGVISADYKDKFDEQGKKILNILVGRTERMSNLIGSVLRYSEIGQKEEKKDSVDLNLSVKEAIDNINIPQNIEVTIENELPVVVCEKTRIVQVFQNLADNAVKYMDKEDGWIKIGCVAEDGWWKFSVSDNGMGIEQKYFEKIFQIFQTLVRRDERDTAGIGLSIVKKIVEEHGGKIWVESKIGQGSTFFFTLARQEMEIENEKFQTNTVS